MIPWLAIHLVLFLVNIFSIVDKVARVHNIDSTHAESNLSISEREEAAYTKEKITSIRGECNDQNLKPGQIGENRMLNHWTILILFLVNNLTCGFYASRICSLFLSAAMERAGWKNKFIGPTLTSSYFFFFSPANLDIEPNFLWLLPQAN